MSESGDDRPSKEEIHAKTEAWLHGRRQPDRDKIGVYGIGARRQVGYEELDSRILWRWGAKRRTTLEAHRDSDFVGEHAAKYSDSMNSFRHSPNELVRLEDVLDIRYLNQGVRMALLRGPTSQPHKSDSSRPEEVSEQTWRQEMLLGMLDEVEYPRGHGLVPIQPGPLTIGDPTFLHIHQDVLDARLDGLLSLDPELGEFIYRDAVTTMLLMQRDGFSPRELIVPVAETGEAIILFDFGEAA